MSRISIAIDVRPLTGAPCGYTIYLGSILHCLRDRSFDLTLIANRTIQPIYEEAHGLDTKIFGSQSNLRWEFGDLPRYLADAGHDVYFTGANRGMPLRKTSTTRYVLGLLDVIPYLFYRDYYLTRWRTYLSRPASLSETAAQLIAIARADAILTISQQSAADIRRVFRRDAVTACLIRLRDVDCRAPVAPRKQFVYVGGVDARKRVDMLLRGFASFGRDNPGYRLILVGSNYAALLPLIEQLGLRDHVELTGYVDHETKFRILGESVAMVYPSLYEGYGMAIAEGFQAGIPVVAGRGGSQEQVGGAGIRTIDPLSPDEIAAAMREMLDPAKRAEWIRRGREQLAMLTDPAIEQATVAFFTEQGRLARQAKALVV